MPTVSSNQFKRVTTALTERLADLLNARVSVVDERGIVVALSEPPTAGDGRYSRDGEDGSYLSIPIQAHGRAGEVLIRQLRTPERNLEAIPNAVVHTLVQLLLKQRLAKAQLEDH